MTIRELKWVHEDIHAMMEKDGTERQIQILLRPTDQHSIPHIARIKDGFVVGRVLATPPLEHLVWRFERLLRKP